MDKNGKAELKAQISKLDFEDRKELFQSFFSMGYIASENLNDRLVLISLVALVTQRMKLKDPKITPLSVLVKISGATKDNSGFYQFLENLAIIVEDFSYGMKQIDACGLKTSQEIINKIKELLNTWLPF